MIAIGSCWLAWRIPKFVMEYPCTINGQHWVGYWFIIEISAVFLRLFTLLFVYKMKAAKECYQLFVFYTNFAAILTWNAYGTFMFFKKTNNCNYVVETRNMNNLMLLLLIVGYMRIAVKMLGNLKRWLDVKAHQNEDENGKLNNCGLFLTVMRNLTGYMAGDMYE